MTLSENWNRLESRAIAGESPVQAIETSDSSILSRAGHV